jgi:ubiquinone biosynthesis protein
LWKTAKPYLERWMGEQIGWRGLVERLKVEAPHYAKLIPQLPRLAHQVLHQKAHPVADQGTLLAAVLLEQRRTNRLLAFLACVTGVAVLGAAVMHIAGGWPT